MRKVKRCRVKKTCAVHCQFNMNGQLTHTMTQSTWRTLWTAIPPLSQRSQPLLFLKSLWRGRLKYVLPTIAKSLKASCHVFLVRRLHT